jgi:hypothetical protein
VRASIYRFRGPLFNVVLPGEGAGRLTPCVVEELLRRDDGERIVAVPLVVFVEIAAESSEVPAPRIDEELLCVSPIAAPEVCRPPVSHYMRLSFVAGPVIPGRSFCTLCAPVHSGW